MGTRGPLKLPTHLRPVTDHTVAGTVAEETPRSAPVKPEAVEADEILSPLWDTIVGELNAAGLLSPADGPTVELALRHFAMARRAFDQVDSVTVRDHHVAGGLKKHPAEQVFRSESDAFLRYAQQLGMTFVARARTPAAKGREDGEGNPFAAPAASLG
jgi:P27 family predicted phage terminase small subunit